MSLSPDQCRAARGLTNLTQQLAEASGFSLRTIARFEKGERTPNPANLRALCVALKGAGIQFIQQNGGVGVRWKGPRKRPATLRDRFSE